MPRPGAVADDIRDEGHLRGRFFMCMLDSHLKMVDTQTYRLYDLLSEPAFDQEAVSGLGLCRSLSDKKSKLLILCHGEDGKSYV